MERNGERITNKKWGEGEQSNTYNKISKVIGERERWGFVWPLPITNEIRDHKKPKPRLNGGWEKLSRTIVYTFCI